MKNKSAITLFLLSFATTISRGQDISAGVFENLAANNAMIEMHYANTLGIDRDGNKIDSRPASKSSAVSLLYKPSASLKQQTVAGYVDRLKAKNPVASKAIADNFGPGKHDYGTIYNGLIKGTNIHSNDAVENVIAYMVLGYMIVNNIQDAKEIRMSQISGLKRQFGPKLSSASAFSDPVSVAKLGEEMKLQFVVVQGGWQSALKSNSLATYQQGIKSIFKTKWGMDFSQLSLTDKGFVKR